MATWNYRTFIHISKNAPEDAGYLTVHEAYYDLDGRLDFFTTNPASPSSKDAAEKMCEAFDKPHAGIIYDDTYIKNSDGSVSYEYELVNTETSK